MPLYKLELSSSRDHSSTNWNSDLHWNFSFSWIFLGVHCTEERIPVYSRTNQNSNLHQEKLSINRMLIFKNQLKKFLTENIFKSNGTVSLSVTTGFENIFCCDNNYVQMEKASLGLNTFNSYHPTTNAPFQLKPLDRIV